MRGIPAARVASVVLAGVLLSGCALPPIVSVASFALDMASYGETGKSVSDHGLSFVMQKDCAVLRLLEGELCREYPDPNKPETALALLEPMGDTAARVNTPDLPADPMELPARLAYLDEPGGRALTSAPEHAAGDSDHALGVTILHGFTATDFATRPGVGMRADLGDYIGDDARPDGGTALDVIHLSDGWLPASHPVMHAFSESGQAEVRG